MIRVIHKIDNGIYIFAKHPLLMSQDSGVQSRALLFYLMRLLDKLA